MMIIIIVCNASFCGNHTFRQNNMKESILWKHRKHPKFGNRKSFLIELAFDRSLIVQRRTSLAPLQKSLSVTRVLNFIIKNRI